MTRTPTKSSSKKKKKKKPLNGAFKKAFGSQRANCVRVIKIVVAQAALDPTHHSTQKLLDKMNELDFREESQYLFMELCKHDGMTGSQLIGATMRNLFEVEI